MPIYEYRCEACGHTLDALQKVSDAPLSECPACAQSALKRLISAPSFRLKGGGWYETDFKSDKERKRNLAESGGGEGGEKKDSGDKPKEAAKAETGTEKKSGDSSKETKKPGARGSGSGSEAA
jgi:putative FmdB family regulatory protein